MEEYIREEEDVEIDLLELASILWRKLWVIILCLILGAGIAGGYTRFFITPQYTATSMIYVLGKTTSLTSLTDLQLKSELTADFTLLATRRPVVNDVLNKLNLDMSYESFCELITVTNPTDTHVLQIDATTPDPKLSKKIANAMADSVADNISSVMVTDKPSIAEHAVTPKEPSSPNLMKNTIMGGLIGALIAVGIIVIQVLLDDTIKTEDDVKKYLHVNALAAFPLEKKKRDSRKGGSDK